MPFFYTFISAKTCMFWANFGGRPCGGPPRGPPFSGLFQARNGGALFGPFWAKMGALFGPFRAKMAPRGPPPKAQLFGAPGEGLRAPRIWHKFSGKRPRAPRKVWVLNFTGRGDTKCPQDSDTGVEFLGGRSRDRKGSASLTGSTVVCPTHTSTILHHPSA